MAYGERKSIDSFYHLKDVDINNTYCRCLACFVGRKLNPDRYEKALREKAIVYNLGRAYCAPESGADQEPPTIAIKSKIGIVLERIVKSDVKKLKNYCSLGGFKAITKALLMDPRDIIAEIEASGLRGRGGAGFYTGKKWLSVFSQSSERKFVVVNADEGDPGAFIDRFILEEDPFCIIEAATIAAYAVGAHTGIIYVRKEYPEAQKILQGAIQEAYDSGLLGKNIFNSAFDFDLKLLSGHGSYLCGEETSLLNAIEGKRPEVLARPPYPSERGLFDAPTLVNNVETLANIPWIINYGGEPYHAMGFANSRGTKCVSLNSLFNRPGLYEVDFGISVRQILENIGGGLRTGENKGVIIGGPLAGVIPPQLFDTHFGFEELMAIGASVGHGGVIAFDQSSSIAELLHHVFSFGAFESCGKCTPCRVGTREIEEHFQKVINNDAISRDSFEKIGRIVEALKHTSLCAHGSGLADFALSIMRHYAEEYKQCFK